jgi:hypothetical protein
MGSQLVEDYELIKLAYCLDKLHYRRENQSARYAALLLAMDALDGVEHVLQKNGFPIQLELIYGPRSHARGAGASAVRGFVISVEGDTRFVEMALSSNRVRVGSNLYKLQHKPFDETLLRAIELEIALAVGSQHLSK